jgi:hypothetical protein
LGKRRSTKGVAGLGWGPSAVILVLFIAAVYSLALGRSLTQLGMRIAIVAAFVGLIYLVWHELAKKNPAFRMGVAGESTIILAIAATALILPSDQIAVSVGMQLIPNYGYLQLAGSGTPELASANAMLSIPFLVIAAIVLVLLFLRMRK